MNKKYIITAAIAVAALGVGATSTIAVQTYAQQNSSSSTTNKVTNTVTSMFEKHGGGHSPIGNDGDVTAVSGTTITMGEQADEGGATYTIDASKATFSKDGIRAQISDIKVGDKIFVEGTVSGNNVAATSVSVGHPGGHKDEGINGDGDGEQSDASEQPGQ